jgi:Fe-Mn family superoxide dismutase
MKKTLYTLLLAATVQDAAAQKGAEPFSLVKLPYAANALEPVISQATIELHYGKHLQTYVNNVNKLIKGTEWQNKSAKEIVIESDGALYNNAGQMVNHDLYFTAFSPNGGGEPTGRLAKAINDKWQNLENFKEEFVNSGASLFGSGWVWLASDKDGRLFIKNYVNGGNPLKDHLTPLLGFDVWEHAYYLDYQNRRLEHLKALWQIVDWDIVAVRYESEP